MKERSCHHCGSLALQRNGHTAAGQQKYHCLTCNVYGTLETKRAVRAAQRQLIGRLQRERVSQRAMARITGLSRPTIVKMLNHLSRTSSLPG
jgi:transposase-like protein